MLKLKQHKEGQVWMGEQPYTDQNQFELTKYVEAEVEFWFARDLLPLLDYSTWESFSKVIDKAKLACVHSGQIASDHFRDVTKVITAGKGAKHEIVDVALTRYACYLIAQNGDPRKLAIARAQTYFAVQTHKQEVSEIATAEQKRVEARRRLTQTEKKFSGILYERGVDHKGIAEIRSFGDQALFGGFSTSQMKQKYNIAGDKPLADYLPTVTLKAKDLATEMTSVNTEQKDLRGKPTIKGEHERNNFAVRRALESRNIFPENLPAEEDIKKVERRIIKSAGELGDGE